MLTFCLTQFHPQAFQLPMLDHANPPDVGLHNHKVTLLRGVPGSGKSTYVQAHMPDALVVSADAYFVRDGIYQFNPAKLPQAHAACLRVFVQALQGCVGQVVVDNTNTTVAEVAPYAALALAYGYELEVVNLQVNPAVAAARNVHGVPAASVEAMAQRLAVETPRLPPWWPQRTVVLSEEAVSAV